MPTITRLRPRHAAAYRTLMLEGYAREPEAFTATVAERAPLPRTWWEARLAAAPDAPSRVYGAFVGETLVGVAGLSLAQRPKERHKAGLFGLYVDAAHRGGGIARALVQAVLEGARARPETRVVQLTVTEGNHAARTLYERCGFEVFGVEPMALRVGDDFASKVHMWCAVG